jgi:putative transposase
MTKFDPRIHHRRSIRLKGYDYSQPGAYFVTLVAHQRQSIFGEVANGVMHLNQCGEILHQVWLELPRHYPHVSLDAFILMPNHIHGVLVLREYDGRGGTFGHVSPPDGGRGGSVGRGSMPANTISGEDLLPDMDQTRPYHVRHGLPEIVRAFKSFSARRINVLRKTPNIPVWQRNYYEHIVRDQSELNRIKQYILDNPMKWAEDKENPTLSINYKLIR